MDILRTLPTPLVLLLPLLLGSCSTSRLVDTDTVLDPGPHRIGTVVDSDVLIASGTSLEVKYAAGNRFFVESGGSLTGLSKGVKNSTIYAEEGAILPVRSEKPSLQIVNVSDAEESYRDRFKDLLPRMPHQARAQEARSWSAPALTSVAAFMVAVTTAAAPEAASAVGEALVLPPGQRQSGPVPIVPATNPL